MQFRFFLRNDFGLLLLLFWLFTLALSSFSYFLSVFISRAQSATYCGFAVFLVRLTSPVCSMMLRPSAPPPHATTPRCRTPGGSLVSDTAHCMRCSGVCVAAVVFSHSHTLHVEVCAVR